MPVQAHPARFEHQAARPIGPAPLALGLGLGEPLEQEAGRCLLERRPVERSFDEGSIRSPETSGTSTPRFTRSRCCPVT